MRLGKRETILNATLSPLGLYSALRRAAIPGRREPYVVFSSIDSDEFWTLCPNLSADGRYTISIFLKKKKKKIKMTVGDLRKTMMWCIFHELFHVFTLKLVNTIFRIRQCTIQKEILHCRRFTSAVFSDACSDSTEVDHHLLCPLLTTV